MSVKKLTPKQIESLHNQLRKLYYNNSRLKNVAKEQIFFWGYSAIDRSFMEWTYDTYVLHNNELDLYFHPFRNAVREEFVIFGQNVSTNSICWAFDEEIYQQQKDVLYDLLDFNNIRNRLEIGYLKEIEIKYDEEQKRIFASDESKSALLARYEDREKPSYDKASMLKNNSEHIFDYILGCERTRQTAQKMGHAFVHSLDSIKFPYKNLPLITPYNYKQYKRAICKLLEFAQYDYDVKADFANNYDLGEFSTRDFRDVYCCITTLCLNKLQYCFDQLMTRHTLINPTLIWQKDNLNNYIACLTGMDNDKINSIVKEFLLYSSEFQFDGNKEYLSFYHPLICVGDTYFFSSALTLITLAQRKLIWKLNKKSQEKSCYKNAISQIANEKEKIMIDKIKGYLSNHGYDIRSNVKFRIEGHSDTDVEIDISIWDKKTGQLLLVECKNFITLDNEIERHKQDVRLLTFAEQRKVKNQVVIDHIQKYMKDAHHLNDIPRNISSVLVAENYGGSNTEKAAIPIISATTLFRLLKKYSFDLLNTTKAIIRQDIFPDNLKLTDPINIDFQGYTMISKFLDNN